VRTAWATDIHLNAAEPDVVEGFCDGVASSGADCLLLGGDIAEAMDVEEQLTMLAARLRMPIYFVLGNHDYYGSSIEAVRERMRRLEDPHLHWLPATGCVQLTPKTALVGHGGWADARIGDFSRAPIMTDILAIADLVREIDRDDLLDGFQNRDALRSRLHALGDDAARTLEPQLAAAISGYGTVLVLMHVPPFREAAWYGGQISGDDWLPHTTCQAVGDILRAAAESAPHVRIEVLCGHTHGEGRATILPNLRTTTRAATYGDPRFELLDVG
jgi:predicted phosphohydrolase